MRKGGGTRGAAAMAIAQVVLVAWGALAFGADYSRGFWPLVGGSLAVGIAGMIAFRGAFAGSGFSRIEAGTGADSLRPLAVVLLALGAVLVLQLVPLPATWLARLAPARHRFLLEYDLRYASQGVQTAWHALSLVPGRTLVSLVSFLSLCVLFAGSVRAFSAGGAERFVRGLLGFGLVLALVGIIQNMTYAGAIYGIWPNAYENKPFGPFVNKNSFAGWMLLALPMALAYASGKAVAGWKRARGDWHNLTVWLGTADGNALMFAVTASLGMGVSLFLTMSRSAIVALLATLGVIGWRSRRKARRAPILVTAVATVAFVACVTAWVGAGTVARRFSEGTGATLQGRIGAWQDGLAMFGDFPVAGVGLSAFGAGMLHYQAHDAINYWSEAHNDYLQWLVETGIVGAALAAAAGVLLVGAVRRRFREAGSGTAYWIRLGATAGLIAIAFQEVADFSLRIPANACLATLLCAIAVADSADSCR